MASHVSPPTPAAAPRTPAMITEYLTESGSVYQVDDDGPLVRRVSGTTPPTPYFGEDGVWQECLSAREYTSPHGTVDLLVHWRDLRITYTSPIVVRYTVVADEAGEEERR